MEGFERFLFMRPLLGLLGNGRFFCRLVAVTLRVSAALIVLFSLATFFQAGKLTFGLPAQGIPGGVLFELFFVLAVYAVVHVFLIRARDVERIAASEFYALSLGSVLLRLLGEAYAAFVSLVAVGGGMFVWFTNQRIDKVLNPVIQAMIPSARDDASFLGGIEFMVSGVLAGLAVLILSYLLSEVLALLARIAAREATLGVRTNHEPQSYRSRFGS